MVHWDMLWLFLFYKASLEKHMTRNMHTSEGSTERKGVQQVKQFQSKFQSCNKRKRFYLRFRSKNSWKNVEKNSTLTKRFLQIYFSKDFSHFRLGPRKWTKLWAFLFFKHPITLSSSARLVIFQPEGFLWENNSQIYEEYGGSQLTSVLEQIKGMTEEARV